MARNKTQGKCELCGEVLGKRAMANHLAKHRASEKAEKETQWFQLHVQGAYNPEYWLYLEAPATASLSTLDKFLRDIWVECCGHLSQFSIGGKTRKLGEVLEPGIEFDYEYDFGDTTELRLQVVAEYSGVASPKQKPVRLLARNEAPDIRCGECDALATQVCVICLCEKDEGWLCEKHAGKHDCEEEMLLPVVNSPRVGQCGYTGD